MHLFSGDVVLETHPAEEKQPSSVDVASGSADRERIAQLEAEVAELRRELETLRDQFAAFQKQFQ